MLDYKLARYYTNKLEETIEEYCLDTKEVFDELLRFLDDDTVKDFLFYYCKNHEIEVF